MTKKIFFTIVMVLIVAAIWSHNARKDNKTVVSARQAKEKEGIKDVDQKLLSFSIDGRSPKGMKQWHLEGNSAEIIDEAIHLNELKAIAYGDETVINLTSDEGIYNKSMGEVELIGNVYVVSDNGITLETEIAKWSQNTKEIYTDSIVHINSKGMKATGKGGMANSEEKTAMLKKDVTVTMEPSTRVDCDGSLDVSYGDNIAIFHDNVRVVDKDGNLFADKLTVEFDPETKELDRVIAEGNVKVKKGNSYTMSEKAIYTKSTKSAKLLGRPRIIIDPAEVSALDKMSKMGNI